MVNSDGGVVYRYLSCFLIVMAIPYVGFLIYICIVIPTIESIGNYSLGLLYSNIEGNSTDLEELKGKLN